jgi:hypothetical protein
MALLYHKLNSSYSIFVVEFFDQFSIGLQFVSPSLRFDHVEHDVISEV